MKSKLKHLLFTAVCILYIEMIHTAPMAPKPVYGAAMTSEGVPIDPVIVKTIIEGIIALVHIIISIRKDRREKQGHELVKNSIEEKLKVQKEDE